MSSYCFVFIVAFLLLLFPSFLLHHITNYELSSRSLSLFASTISLARNVRSLFHKRQRGDAKTMQVQDEMHKVDSQEIKYNNL